MTVRREWVPSVIIAIETVTQERKIQIKKVSNKTANITTGNLLIFSLYSRFLLGPEGRILI